MVLSGYIEKGRQYINKIRPAPFRSACALTGNILVIIVGEGLQTRAMYFLVHEDDPDTAVKKALDDILLSEKR